EIAPREAAADVLARDGLGSDLDQRLADLEAHPRPNRAPLQSLDGEILADGAGPGGVAFLCERVQPLQRVEAYRPRGTAVEAEVPVLVALHAFAEEPGGGDAVLGDAAFRVDVDLVDAGGHR